MIYDVIYSLLVLFEKLAFFNKQLQGFIISSMEMYMDYRFHCENQVTYIVAILLQKYYILSGGEFCKKHLIPLNLYLAMS